MFPFATDSPIVQGAVGFADGIGGDDVIAFCVGGTAVLTFCLLLFGKFIAPVMRRVNKGLDWFEKFREDWDGRIGDAGHARIPGVMERLNNIDGEFKRDGNGSMKSQIVKAVAAIEEVKADVVAVKETVESMVSPSEGGSDNRINTGQD